MKEIGLRCLLLALTLGGPLCVQAGLIFNRHAKPTGPDVLVVGDVFAKDLPGDLKPSRDKPVYYVLMGGLEHDIGGAVADEPMPDIKIIRSEVAKALSPQGYIETQVGGASPKLVIIFTFGSAAYDDFVDNRKEMNALAGAQKEDSRLLSTNDADMLHDASRGERVYLMVAALDAEALRKKEKKLLWVTRISIDALHHTLPDSLTIMLKDAGPYFGQNTDRPIFRDDDSRRDEVKIGDLKFLDEAPPAETQPKK